MWYLVEELREGVVCVCAQAPASIRDSAKKCRAKEGKK